MKAMLLAAAAGIAAIALSGEAQAQDWNHRHTTSGERLTRTFRAPASPFDCNVGARRMSRDGRGDGQVVACGGYNDYYGGEWALYNNRGWEPDSYNDWWHDRSDRAYPAWMRRNQDCARQWYSGDTLRC